MEKGSIEDFVDNKLEEYDIEGFQEIDEKTLDKVIEREDQAMANMLILMMLERQPATDSWIELLSEFALPEETGEGPNYCPNCGEKL